MNENSAPHIIIKSQSFTPQLTTLPFLSKHKQKMASKISVAILGVGMMGQEHISYMSQYSQIQIKFLCDTNADMLQKAKSMVTGNSSSSSEQKQEPKCFSEEKDLLNHVSEIDLLVIATPNYMHTPHLLRWANHSICILVEKPVAISEKQVLALQVASPSFKAKIWVAMEYRYIPAIQKLYQLLPTIGPIKNITIRENRFPFLSKVSKYNHEPIEFQLLIPWLYI